ncbi:aminomethyl-transferring glycine dehydrogenase [Aestuariirhabdus litorea]|uniref:Glycine dehydrogenase (decarboxylating) n=1 Tax=Aestuariirhabdus litorea TaxID=2528527 RepID=A0A3P3VL39_9GAMM|nr:aminomethyl-transferring glycine dehydrogenase [Aestuariirhabdus litorea]RRJ83037.1 glycine dehydrogenase (aminomethyl-transferring) [Aestuariirhabdus litorea]RWW93195.1 glycine dehydrogenase (aminomethyl-transferring) [Endozoicomonadaceae bacterium GTF-13]
MSHPSHPTLEQLENSGEFIERHVGPDAQERQQMLDTLGVDSLAELIDETVPRSIRLPEPLALAGACTEAETLGYLKQVAAKNRLKRSLIGMGYHETLVPNVILRNVMENPGWYTAYTPYQPEVAQGRLEALITFQQMTMDLTGMDLASASLLDEATAAAEAMALAKRVSKNKKSNLFFVDELCLPQTIDVVKTRAEAFGFEVMVGAAEQALEQELFGVLLQYPCRDGSLRDDRELIASLQERKAIVCVAADILALVMLASPGTLGADVVLGSAQRFGVPMGFGGPHAAFFATRDQYKRSMPGRIIGVSVDSRGNPALRMAMQTREQHIRREKANSNICTAQVLLANMAAFYAVYHGPEGLKRIANRVHRLTDILARGLKQGGLAPLNSSYFDTLSLDLGERREALLAAAEAAGYNLYAGDAGVVTLSLNECCSRSDVETLWEILLGAGHGLSVAALDAESSAIPAALKREEAILTHEVFNRYHSETEMLRYLKRLENKDLSLTHSMIALGSCTMKLNATSEMIPVTWAEFGNMHPFAPASQTAGYQQMIAELEAMLKEITGFDAICMQPNSGAQGEYAGLLAIRKYHESRGEGHRNVCLIPSSAHGTNPASAMMASMRVVVVECDSKGNVDVADLRAKAEELSDSLSCLMITYPSTHGVYEEEIIEICNIIHQHGGQVYMDGANLNAQVGLSKPGLIGADVSHMNLHKTFAIPHGGGGPGMGPIGVKAHLAPFVANHSVVKLEGPNPDSGAVSAAPWGSASILPISWAYIRMLGAEGLRTSTETAILNANYMARRLGEHYPVLYSGRNGRVAHECIIDLRPLKAVSGISEEDVAKRLIDFGFHAPTMSFPVAGTLMIEPTESESKAELDRFVDAMIAIRSEIAQVEAGTLDADNNMLKNAPHTLADIMDENWDRPYSKQQGAYPLSWVAEGKFWPSVNRIDNVYGDRNLHCSCPTTDSYR